LATECTPSAARVVYSSGGINAEIPPTDPAYNNWIGPISALARQLGVPLGNNSSVIQKDNIHQCSDKKPTVGISAKKVSGKTYRIDVTVNKGTHELRDLTVSVGGSPIQSFNLSGSTTKSFNHTFSGSGSRIINALLVDKVLYSGTAATQISIAGSSGGNNNNGGNNPPPPTNVSPISVGGSSSNASVSWSAESTAAQYRVCVGSSNPPSTCFIPSGTGTTYAPSGLTGTNYVYVEALDSSGSLIPGSTSSIITIQ